MDPKVAYEQMTTDWVQFFLNNESKLPKKGVASSDRALNANITQATIQDTICNPNWHGVNPWSHQDAKGTSTPNA